MLKCLGFKKSWVSLLMVAFFAIAIGVMIQTGKAAEKVGPQIGYKTPNFTLNSLSAKNMELYPVIAKNKVTLINFWGKWCPYCVQEIPELVKFYKQYHLRQVEIVAVNVGDNPKDVPLFAKENQMVFPVLIDKSNTVSNLYQVSGFPTTFIINRQGKIKDMIVGGTNQATLAAKVETVLREK